MRASMFTTWTALISMLLGTVGQAQTPAPAKPAAAKKAPASQQTISSLDKLAAMYQSLLDDKISGPTDPDERLAVYQKFVSATCQSKWLH